MTAKKATPKKAKAKAPALDPEKYVTVQDEIEFLFSRSLDYYVNYTYEELLDFGLTPKQLIIARLVLAKRGLKFLPKTVGVGEQRLGIMLKHLQAARLDIEELCVSAANARYQNRSDTDLITEYGRSLMRQAIHNTSESVKAAAERDRAQALTPDGDGPQGEIGFTMSRSTPRAQPIGQSFRELAESIKATAPADTGRLKGLKL
jgi:hypothetical protein